LGQKVNPIGFRLGYIKGWESVWFASKKDYADRLHEDIHIRKMVKERLYHAGLARIEIERSGNQLRLNLHTARPGVIIGRKGAEVDKLKADLDRMTDADVYINIREIKKPEINATLVAESVASQLERRMAFRRAMKKSVASAMRFGAKGIRIGCGGRLAGTEIARSEWYREGRVPLHTLRADIDYGAAEARTTYGRIGVKVWIYNGDVLPEAGKAPRQGTGA
jgi:small subunit ribosomal protein S3